MLVLRHEGEMEGCGEGLGLVQALVHLVRPPTCTLCAGESGGKGRVRRRRHRVAPGTPPRTPDPVVEEDGGSRLSLESLSHYALLTLVTVVAYRNATTGDFVHDDMSAIVTNEDALGKTSILRLLQNDFWGMDMRDR